MELKQFEGANKKELSMIEVARAILHENNGQPMAFADLTNAIQEYTGKSDEEIRERLSQFYTDLNVDGSFISMGDNRWALRSWYSYESIDEALVHTEDDDEEHSHSKRKKVNAFLDDDDTDDNDDVISYDDDDDDFDDDDDDSNELKQYNNDLKDIDEENEDDSDDLPDGIEGQLSELSDDFDDEEN